MRAEQWLVDGNYFSRVRPLVWPRATAVIWLNFSFPLVLGRALARTVGRIASQEPLFAGNVETWRGAFFAWDGIPWWVLRTFHSRRRELRRALAEESCSHLQVIEVRHPQAAEALVARALAPHGDAG
jgi:hypothetical protein